MAKNKKKLLKRFKTERLTGWKKEDTQTQRRRITLLSRKGNLLSVARALMWLSNKTNDLETQKKARADAQYFYALYKAKQKREKR